MNKITKYFEIYVYTILSIFSLMILYIYFGAVIDFCNNANKFTQLSITPFIGMSFIVLVEIPVVYIVVYLFFKSIKE